MTQQKGKARLMGINHVALEVGDIDEALEFYQSLFDFELRGRGKTTAFLDMGDQFLALSGGHDAHRDSHRHFGLVVDERTQLRQAIEARDIELLPSNGLDFLDPWGNRIQIVEYSDIQFMKADPVLKGMGLAEVKKTDKALKQLQDKGLYPGES